MNTGGVQLLQNVSVVGNGPMMQWTGGNGLFYAGGTFGGSSLTLEFALPDGTFAPVRTLATDGTQTTVALLAPGGFVFLLPPVTMRAVLTGGAPNGISARADIIPS